VTKSLAFPSSLLSINFYLFFFFVFFVFFHLFLLLLQ